MASLKVCGMNVISEFYIAGVLALSAIAIVIWFLIMVLASYVPPPRAVTSHEHAACLALPHDSQVMENKRSTCFNELYGSGRFKQL